jgi:D-3-phosphoglycerate dehydrogenase
MYYFVAMKGKILIYDELHPALLDGLKNTECEVIYLPNADKDTFLQLLPDMLGIVGRTKFQLNKEVLSSGKSLKFIARGGAGLDDIDLTYCHQHNIAVLNAPEGNANAVAEHALGLLLALNHKIWASALRLKAGFYEREPHRGFEIAGKQLHIVGLGNNGYAFAKKAIALGMCVSAYDPYKTNWPNEITRLRSLEAVAKDADVISFHVPLTDETRGMVNEQFFNQCTKKPILLNCSRGKIMNTKNLLTAVNNGIVSSVGLDVLENEKPLTYSNEEKKLFSQLINHPNILVTPHIAGLTQESAVRISEILAEKISTYLQG